jgi:cation diffusion facilitator CzcD-associated flavoprotein CzcO
MADTATTPSQIPDLDALIVGAGFSGLAMLHRLRENGLHARILEAGTGVGGTWYWNRYPGARTDSEFYYYCYHFSQAIRDEWTWKERYPAQPEMLAYLDFVARKLDLYDDIVFETKVERARYDADDNVWRITTAAGKTLTARYLISAMGVLSAPTRPDIPGYDRFAGDIYQTATWPKDGVDLSGKRVGVLGVGASGVQIVPVIAPQVDQLYVLQRTPNYVVASSNYEVGPDWNAKVRISGPEDYAAATAHGFAVPFEKPTQGARWASEEERNAVFEKGWREGGFHFMLETFNDLAVDEVSNAYASEFIRRKIRETVKDPRTADLLSPKDYPFNGKRPPGGHSYYEAYNRDNVHLIDVKSTPITEITPDGVMINGEVLNLDVLILATGFDAMTGTLTRIDIVGRDGLVLRDKWRDGLRTNLGVSVNGFPNFFMILGPQTPYANLPVAIQEGVSFVERAILFARRNGIATIESTPEAEEAWAAEVARAGEATIMAKGGGAYAWFLGANVPGKPREFNVYMGGADFYFRMCEQVVARDFETFIEGAQPKQLASNPA